MLQNIADVDYLTYPHTPDQHKPAVVVFHGYGANCHNLYPLIDWIKAEVQWYFPNGLFPVELHEPGARTWFPLEAEYMDYLMAHKDKADYAQLEPPGFHTSLLRMQKFTDQVLHQHPSLLLAGFSQGAMALPHLAARIAPTGPVRGMMLFSTNLMYTRGLENHATGSALRHMPILQSHGREDNVLSFTRAQRDFAYLQHECGCSGAFMAFDGGHEIPVEVCYRTSDFIKRQRVNNI